MTKRTTILMLVLSACGSPGGPRPAVDAGPALDAPGPAVDAPVVPGTDAGPAVDAPVTPTPDAGPGVDAPVSPSPDAGPPLDPETRAGFARRAAEITCAAWGTCPRCTPATPTCVATMEERTLRVDPPENFHPDRALAYLELLEAAYAACEQITGREWVDNYPYYGPGAPAVFHADGTVTLGDTCTGRDDCQTHDCRWYAPPGGFGMNMCYPAPAPSAREVLCR